MNNFISALAMAMLLRMCYEVSQPESDSNASNLASTQKTEMPDSLIRRLAEKSIEGYARVQERKWRNWARSLSK